MYKASRGIEDIYELTKVRKDGSSLLMDAAVTLCPTEDLYTEVDRAVFLISAE